MKGHLNRIFEVHWFCLKSHIVCPYGDLLLTVDLDMDTSLPLFCAVPVQSGCTRVVYWTQQLYQNGMPTIVMHCVAWFRST